MRLGLPCPCCGELCSLRQLYRLGWRKACPFCGAAVTFEPRSGARIGAAIGLLGGALLAAVGPERFLDWRCLAGLFVVSFVFTSFLILCFGSLIAAKDVPRVRTPKWPWVLFAVGFSVKLLAGAAIQVWQPTNPDVLIALMKVCMGGAIATVFAMLWVLFGKGGVFRRKPAVDGAAPPSGVATR